MVTPDHLSCFRGKTVLITGDTGFKGSWLSFWLHELGAKVVGIALPPDQKDGLFEALELHKKIRHSDVDIRNVEVVQKIFNETKPEFVFHLAAQSLVRKSYFEPKATWDTNVGGSTNILEAVRSCSSVKSLIYVTSDKCYKNKEWLWGYRENDELGGHDLYSSSKAAAELLFTSYQKCFLEKIENLGASSVRAGNVIGGGDWSADRIVPDCITSLLKHAPIPVRNPASIRPWQHVLDPLNGYLLLAYKQSTSSKELSGNWNFGPDATSNKTVMELVNSIIEHWGSGSFVTPSREGQVLHEASLLQLNCDKAKHILNWRPVWDFKRTINETIFWYKALSEKRNMEEVTRHQIQTFMKDIQL